MAENFSELDMDDLRKQIPRNTWGSRFRGMFGGNEKLVIPDASQLESTERLERGIETWGVTKRVKASAEIESKNQAVQESAKKELVTNKDTIEDMLEALDISAAAMRQVGELVGRMREGLKIESTVFNPNAVTAIDRAVVGPEDRMLIARLVGEYKESSRIIQNERGKLSDTPVAEDLKMLERVVDSEKKVVVLAREVREALAELKSENVSVVNVDRLMGLMTVFKAERSSTVSVVAGSEEVMKGLGELEVRRVARDSEAAKNWKSITNYEHDVLRLEDPKIAPNEKEMNVGDLKKEMGERLDELKIKDGKVRIKILERVGIKGEEVDKDGLLAKRELHQAKYEAAIQKMEALLEALEQRPTAAVEAYLALNHAIVEGSAVVQLDNAIKIVMMKTKTDFMSLVLKSIPMPSESTGALLLKFDMFGRKSEGKMYEIIGKAARQVEEFARNVAKWAESEADRAKGKNLTNTNN
jgi:hypothetical protein